MLFELPRIEHVDARDAAEAISYLRKHAGKAMVIAGATDLLALMKDRIEGPKLKSPEVLINIKAIPGLASISHRQEGGLSIGAAVTLQQLIESVEIQQRFAVISRAALQVGTTQLRNMGTLGGNLCQRPRCIYFRHPHFGCFKKGDKGCPAAGGEHRVYHSITELGKCVMAHPSDLAPALVALKASAVIVGPDEERKIPMCEFFAGPNEVGETVLRAGEFLLAVEVPDQPPETRQVFLKHRIRRASDFAVASVALVATMEDNICREVSIVLGGVASMPYVAVAAEGMVRGETLSERLIATASEAALERARPLPGNGYKVDLIKALVRRSLTSLLTHG